MAWARRRARSLVTVVLVSLLVGAPATAQTLDSALVAAIRRGPVGAMVRGPSTTVAMVGSPTLPLLEARINGRGPYRLLVDLGSNVTLLRRDVVDATATTVLVERTTSDIIRMDSLLVSPRLALVAEWP